MRLLSLFTFTLCSTCLPALMQLSLAGGGSLGAIEIGILKRLTVIEPTLSFDLLTGISAGSINAAFLSYFYDLKQGIAEAEVLYSLMTTDQIYSKLPLTGISIYNTDPLRQTLTAVIDNMKTPPVIHTLIGAVNLYTGNLDIFTFSDNSDEDKVNLIMASSAIPMMFPPITYKGSQYADGGTLSNELLDILHDNSYLNITFVTPYQGLQIDNTSITSFEQMVKRTSQIVTANFDNPIVDLNQDCDKPIGEVNMFFVPSETIDRYDSLNFDYGRELIEIGYNNVQHKQYKIC